MTLSAVSEDFHLYEVLLPVHDLHEIVLNHDAGLYTVLEHRSLSVKSGCYNPFGLVTVPGDKITFATLTSLVAVIETDAIMVILDLGLNQMLKNVGILNQKMETVRKNDAKRSRQQAGKRYREYAQRRVCFINEQVP